MNVQGCIRLMKTDRLCLLYTVKNCCNFLKSNYIVYFIFCIYIYIYIYIYIQWATLVTHHFLRAHIFSQKCWNRTFSMIIYLLTFYLFDDIENEYRNHSCESFCYAKGNFDKSARLHVQSERLYFLFAFCARHYPWWSLWQKNTKNIFLFM